MTLWQHYYVAQDVRGALQALSGLPGAARLIAGGTDLLLDLQQGRHPPVDTLIDITAVPEMTCLEIRQAALYIGAALPLNQILASPLIHQHAPGLADACGLIGGPQVRNVATLGGNVAHALPAADGAISLLAHGAEAEVANLSGRRRMPVEELFAGPGKSTLDPHCELLLGFWLPLRQAGQASAFRRVMRPQGVAIAILNMAVWLERQEDRIADIRLVVGPAGPRPLRARQAEAALRGCNLINQTMDMASQALLGEVRFRTSPHRATFEYRQHLARILLSETLAMAWERTL
jgi:CO/xanthine dehydrogenase FAD-binding subunit